MNNSSIFSALLDLIFKNKTILQNRKSYYFHLIDEEIQRLRSEWQHSEEVKKEKESCRRHNG